MDDTETIPHLRSESRADGIEDGPLTDTDVCIVGGGPAGMITGLLLARRGLTVTVLEKHADPARGPSGRSGRRTKASGSDTSAVSSSHGHDVATH